MPDPMGREETLWRDADGVDHWRVWELQAGKARGRTLRVGTEVTFNPWLDQRIRGRFKEARKSEVGHFNVLVFTGVQDGLDYTIVDADIVTVHRGVTPSPNGKTDK